MSQQHLIIASSEIIPLPHFEGAKFMVATTPYNQRRQYRFPVAPPQSIVIVTSRTWKEESYLPLRSSSQAAALTDVLTSVFQVLR
jgi:hypothetical protein